MWRAIASDQAEYRICLEPGPSHDANENKQRVESKKDTYITTDGSDLAKLAYS